MAAGDRGRLGEGYAAQQLAAAGYTVLCRNYRSPYGEIDLIAHRGEILAFVEVKTRGPGALATGAEAVDARKQHRILRTAEHYLLRHPSDLQPRFDLAQVVLADRRGFAVAAYHYIEGAFEAHESTAFC